MLIRGGENLTEESVREICRGTTAHYKIPQYIRFVAEMPLTATGKPQNFKMCKEMISELGLENTQN